MTKEESIEKTKEYIKVMQAYVENKSIQVSISGVWSDYLEKQFPTWSWENFNYRIKPEPTYKPYDVKTLTEAIAKHGYTVKRKDAEEYVVIGSWNPYGFTFAWDEELLAYSVLLEKWTWADTGEACGVLTDNNE